MINIKNKIIRGAKDDINVGRNGTELKRERERERECRSVIHRLRIEFFFLIFITQSTLEKNYNNNLFHSLLFTTLGISHSTFVLSLSLSYSSSHSDC